MEYKYEVTVICLTYNHGKYIKNALEGFVNQKVNFPYRVIVHDDASTDNTAEVIREYQSKYPDIIHAICQTENLYSQNKAIFKPVIAPIVDSRYIAICEGDDCWIDKNKLQKQYDAMQSNPHCTLCLHRVQSIATDGNATGELFPSWDMKEQVICSKDFINMCRTYSFHTSSYFIKAEAWLDIINDPPKFRQVAPVGDEPMLLYFGDRGDVYYIPEIMSSYRRGVEGSWSDRIGSVKNTERYIKHLDGFVKMLVEFNEYSNHKYADMCDKKIGRYLCKYLILTKEAKEMLKKENKKYYTLLSAKEKIFLLFASVCPSAAKKIYVSKLQGSAIR